MTQEVQEYGEWRTERTARKEHRCDHCRWKARTGRAHGSDTIEKGQPYIECYAYGDDVYHPARYHKLCWTEMHTAPRDEFGNYIEPSNG